LSTHASSEGRSPGVEWGAMPERTVLGGAETELPKLRHVHLGGSSEPQLGFSKILNRTSRHSTALNSAPVSCNLPRTSLNFCDWPRGDPRHGVAVADFPQPTRRNKGPWKADGPVIIHL
jgi:hypothetical protein